MNFSHRLIQNVTKRKYIEEAKPPPQASAPMEALSESRIEMANATVHIIEHALNELDRSSAQWEHDFQAWKKDWREHLRELSFDNVLLGVYGPEYLNKREAKEEASQQQQYEFQIHGMSSFETLSSVDSLEQSDTSTSGSIGESLFELANRTPTQPPMDEVTISAGTEFDD